LISKQQQQQHTVLSNIRIISNRNREGDGDETAGVRLCQRIKEKGSEWAHVPFMIYCWDTSLVKDLPQEEGVYLTSKSADVIQFVFGK